jgi:two-component system LytT family response regulator
MARSILKVIVADDERPARKFLTGLLKSFESVQLVGEAESGEQAVALIEAERPHLALLDLQMPEIGGLDVARQVSRAALPLIAFVTAYDDHAIEAFEVNAIDYLLKPVQRSRLDATLDRARQRLRTGDTAEERAAAVAKASDAYERATRRQFADRIPVKRRDEVILVPVRQIAAIVADGELLQITTASNEVYTIAHRLHALEERLDPRRFVRLSRSTLANVDLITRISPMPGGTYMARLTNGQQLQVSRIQSRVIRDTLLKL